MAGQVPFERRATEYLANERTFLAWIRTSIAIISLGFVVARFSVWIRELSISIAPGRPASHTGMSMLIGSLMMAFGGMLAILAACHYRRVNKAIRDGEVRADHRLIIVITLGVVLLAALMIGSMIMTERVL